MTESWGRFPKFKDQKLVPLFWRDEAPRAIAQGQVLPYGLGRSYGDVCLNEGGTLLSTRNLDRLIHFDREQGILRCEAGTSFQEILELIVPSGWFLPVTPGTQFVTLGGAIANDVHGKNHHRAGTLGCHVRRFELCRSDGSMLTCSLTENEDLFKATLGGLGLTGLITWAEIQLKKISTPVMSVVRKPFHSLSEFFILNEQLEAQHEYTVAWIDGNPAKTRLGRGILFGGNHAEGPIAPSRSTRPPSGTWSVPCLAPRFLLNTKTISAFNRLYFSKQSRGRSLRLTHYAPFFYPLDSLLHWNRLYGKPGFLQYQCVLPQEGVPEALREMTRGTSLPFLGVLKRFGSIASPGILSFPRPGFTLAADFPNRGHATLAHLERLDSIVRSHGGAVYPAKDARMSPESFRAFYPRLDEFLPHVDPGLSSSFWRRVNP